MHVPVTAEQRQARARIAYNTRYHDPAKLDTARRDLTTASAVALVDEAARLVADAAPPITEEQRERVAALLRTTASAITRGEP